MKSCCASNAAINNVKIPGKKSPFFHNIFNTIVIFPKSTDFLEKIRYIEGLLNYQARSKDSLEPNYNTIIKNIQYNKITWRTQIRNLQ